MELPASHKLKVHVLKYSQTKKYGSWPLCRMLLWFSKVDQVTFLFYLPRSSNASQDLLLFLSLSSCMVWSSCSLAPMQHHPILHKITTSEWTGWICWHLGMWCLNVTVSQNVIQTQKCKPSQLYMIWHVGMLTYGFMRLHLGGFLIENNVVDNFSKFCPISFQEMEDVKEFINKCLPPV